MITDDFFEVARDYLSPAFSCRQCGEKIPGFPIVLSIGVPYMRRLQFRQVLRSKGCGAGWVGFSELFDDMNQGLGTIIFRWAGKRGSDSRVRIFLCQFEENMVKKTIVAIQGGKCEPSATLEPCKHPLWVLLRPFQGVGESGRRYGKILGKLLEA